MRKLLTISIAAVIFIGCSSEGGKKPTLPARPASIKAVQDEIRGKNYKTERAGTHGTFSTDTSITWIEPAKENKFEQEVLDESKTFRLNFINDTSVTMIF